MAGGINAATMSGGSGYWRGAPPRRGGTGSMAGPSGAGSRPSVTSSGKWEPSVVNLLVLVAIELAAFAGLRYVFRAAHGG